VYPECSSSYIWNPIQLSNTRNIGLYISDTTKKKLKSVWFQSTTIQNSVTLGISHTVTSLTISKRLLFLTLSSWKCQNFLLLECSKNEWKNCSLFWKFVTNSIQGQNLQNTLGLIWLHLVLQDKEIWWKMFWAILYLENGRTLLRNKCYINTVFLVS